MMKLKYLILFFLSIWYLNLCIIIEYITGNIANNGIYF